MKYTRFFLVLALILCAGCTHVISKESMLLVDRSLSFDQLKTDPDRYVGSYVLLGGAIASVSNIKQMGQLEIVQFQLDRDNMPVEPSNSGGRFLAQTGIFLDPLVFKPGRLVTMVGEVKGHKEMRLDQVEYNYPVIAIREIYLWRPMPAYPYYYPYYDDFWWRHHRPWGPWW